VIEAGLYNFVLKLQSNNAEKLYAALQNQEEVGENRVNYSVEFKFHNNSHET
jgi:hypothetical protein